MCVWTLVTSSCWHCFYVHDNLKQSKIVAKSWGTRFNKAQWKTTVNCFSKPVSCWNYLWSTLVVFYTGSVGIIESVCPFSVLSGGALNNGTLLYKPQATEEIRMSVWAVAPAGLRHISSNITHQSQWYLLYQVILSFKFENTALYQRCTVGEKMLGRRAWWLRGSTLVIL